MRIGVLVVVAACSASPTAKFETVGPKQGSTPGAGATTKVVKPVDPLNLDFEVADGAAPKGWRIVVGNHHEVALDRDAHHGATSLRIASIAGALMTDIGASYVTLDATPYRGKHVRVHGWVKTSDIDNQAGIWMRADDGLHGFDERSGRVTQNGDWKEVVSEVTLTTEASRLDIGARLVGHGTAWFDALTIEAIEQNSPPQIVASGHVVDAAGRPVAKADVVMSGYVDDGHVVTDDSGAFRFTTTPGRWSFAAHHAPDVGAFVEWMNIERDTSDIQIKLANRGGTTIHGRVMASPPSGSYVLVTPDLSAIGGSFAAPVAADGRFTAVVPGSDRYLVSLRGGLVGDIEVSSKRPSIDVSVTPLEAAEPEVNNYVRDHAIRIETADPQHSLEDLAPLGEMFGKAHIVGLGEASHGTREFFQLKHRIIKELVANKGFTTIAFEGFAPEARAVDDYIKTGKGDARSALSGLGFWIWNTEEVVALIEWMRAWNADPAHPNKITFAGFDIQSALVAYRTVVDYLRQVDPDSATTLVASIAMLDEWDPMMRVRQADDVSQKTLARALVELAAHFDHHEANYRKRSSVDYATVRHDVTLLQQFVRMYSAGSLIKMVRVRDEEMTNNIEWLRKQAGSDGKVILWAHNGHIMNYPKVLGSYLRRRFGADYVGLGFMFGQGAFQSWMGDFGPTRCEVPASSPLGSAAPFMAVGSPILALDLRNLPAGPIARWFRASRPTWNVGSEFRDEHLATQMWSLADVFDVTLFVANTTRARPARTY